MADTLMSIILISTHNQFVVFYCSNIYQRWHTVLQKNCNGSVSFHFFLFGFYLQIYCVSSFWKKKYYQWKIHFYGIRKSSITLKQLHVICLMSPAILQKERVCKENNHRKQHNSILSLGISHQKCFEYNFEQ